MKELDVNYDKYSLEDSLEKISDNFNSDGLKFVITNMKEKSSLNLTHLFQKVKATSTFELEIGKKILEFLNHPS